MKRVLEKISSKTLFSAFSSLDKTILKSRKKMSLYSGVDTNSFYHVVFQIEQKSRFVFKNAQEVVDFEKIIVLHVNHNYKYKHLLLCAPLCSRAQKYLQEEGWRIYNDVM